MKNTILAAAFVATLPMLAHAETIKFPSEAPVASVTIPESWGPKETESGVDATSDDSAVYVAIDVANGSTTDKVIDEAIDFLSKSGVKIDPSTQKDTEPTDVNGMKMATLDWDGTDEDGPVSVGLAIIATTPEKFLIVTYWGTKGEEDKHDKELASILMSITPSK
jgi:hypothetical protein